MPEVDLDQLAEEMLQEEVAMRKRLDDFRRTVRSKQASWQENLLLVSQDAAERRSWASTFEQDVNLQKQIKKTRVSDLYLRGPSSAANGGGAGAEFALLKLLAEASKKSGVTIPRQFAVDLQKSNLPQLYQQQQV